MAHQRLRPTGALQFEYDDDGIVRDQRDSFITLVVAAAFTASPEGTSADDLLEYVTDWVRAEVDLTRPHKGKHLGDDGQLEKFLRGKIRYALRNETKIRNGKHKRGVVPGIEPDRRANPMTPYAATETLRATLQEFLSVLPFWDPVAQLDAWLTTTALAPAEANSADRLLVRGAAGLGKSTMLLTLLDEMFKASDQRGDVKRRVFYLCPTIELAEELAGKYRAMGGKGVVIRGRTHGLAKDPENTPCLKPKDVEVATSAGLYVASSLCKRYDEETKTFYACEHYENGCRYYAQADENADIVFMSHDMAMVNLDQDLFGKADLLVIDESILSKLTSTGSGIAFDDMLHSEHLTRLHGVLTNDPKADPIASLIAMGITWENFRDEQVKLEEADKAARTTIAFPGIDSTRLVRNAAEFKAKRSRATTIRMLRNLKREMRAGRTSDTRSFTFAPEVLVPATDKTPAHTTKLVFLQHRPRVKILRGDLPVLMLDATGNAALMDYSFPGIKQITIEAERNAYVVQTTGNSGAMRKIGSRSTDKYREEVAHAAHDMAKQHGSRGVVVATKDAIEFGLNRLLPEGVETIYFGNLRGIDKYKDFDWILIAARMQVSALEAERYAKALAYDSAEPLRCPGTYTDQLAGYDLAIYDDRSDSEIYEDWLQTLQARGHPCPEDEARWQARQSSHDDKKGVLAPRHVDPLVEAIRQQFTEAESIQAIDRLRLVFRGADPNIDVLSQQSWWLGLGRCTFVRILSEVPLPGIVVNELQPYKEAVGRTGKRGGGGGPGSLLKKWFDELGGVLPQEKHKWLAERFGTTPNAVNCAMKDFRTRGHGDFEKLLGATLYYDQWGAGRLYAVSGERARAFHDQWRAEHAKT